MEPSENGYVALVCYLSEPQNSCIEALRLAIPGRAPAPVHITVLPPRPLKLPLEEACQLIVEITRSHCAFDAELSEVRHFRESDFLYLDIGVGSAELCGIHHRLDAGALQHPEPYEFRPHLTLVGPLASHEVQEAQEQMEREWKASTCPRSIRIEELVCLWQEPGEAKDWKRHRSILLLGNETRLPVSA